MRTARNVAIVLLLTAVVAFIPGGGTSGSVVGQFLGIVFLAGLAFLGYRLYRENRVMLYGLGDRNRGILYASGGAALLAVSGTQKLWDTGAGTAVWFVVVAAAVAGVMYVISAARQY
jgi:hypothetical protein